MNLIRKEVLLISAEITYAAMTCLETAIDI